MNNESFEPNYTVINDSFAAEQKRKNGFSIASLVLGIFAVACCCVPYIPLILGILALIFSILDKKTNDTMNGMAIAGMICGIIAIVLQVVSIVENILMRMDNMKYMQFLEELLNSMESEGEVAFRALPFLR